MKTIAFLDFDGVLCDSLPECYVSSFIGYFRYYLGEEPGWIEIEHYRQFHLLRPFIRRGADYLLLQKIIGEAIPCASQEDFDSILRDHGGELSDQFHRMFYRVREELLEEDRDYWLSLSRIFPPFLDGMPHWASHPACYILSTKKAEFIHEILLHKGIHWPLERIIYSGTESKSAIIDERLEGLGAERGFFIEDQIDHLYRNEVARIETALAEWGYVQPEWLRQGTIQVFSYEDLQIRMEEITSQ